MPANSSWDNYCNWDLSNEALGITLNFAGVGFDSELIDSESADIERAFDDMRKLELGERVNSDEGRMVGHYWLRKSELSPSKEIQAQIESALKQVEQFSSKFLAGEVTNMRGEPLDRVLLVGIGGSALGPQLLADCFGPQNRLFFIDNTDPDGIERTLYELTDLSKTLVLVVSKSGGTRETRNGELLVSKAFSESGLSFEDHAVAITQPGSALEKRAASWLEVFHVWEWVGGRTSLFSPVGLLPAALLGIDTSELLVGAAEMDEWTRQLDEPDSNPAIMLALAWRRALSLSKQNFVILPYSDRLLLMSRYLQQLIMESLGKRHSRSGAETFEGLSVFGNKGSTDQHAFVQQLRDGRNDFLCCFLEVLNTSAQGVACSELEDGLNAADYLSGFLNGTREALAEDNRLNCTLTLSELSARSFAAVIALFERAVGFYASMAEINAYHQPGVEAGKKAAKRCTELQASLSQCLGSRTEALTIDQLAQELDAAGEEATLFHICRRLAATGKIKVTKSSNIKDWTFSCDT